MPINDENQQPARPPNTHSRRIHLTTLHQIAAPTQHQFIPAKEALINTNVATQFTVHSPQIGRTNTSCNSINLCTSAHESNNSCVNHSQQVIST